MIYIRYTENRKSIFGENINLFVGKVTFQISAEFLGFRTENVITRTPYSRFARNSQERYSNFEAQVPVKPEKIKLSYEIGLGKCENPIFFGLGLFSAKIFKYVCRKGGQKSEFWGQN